MQHTVDLGTRVLGERAHYEQRAGTELTSDSGALVLDETRSTLATAAYIQDRMAFRDETILVTPGIRFEYARYHRRIDRQPTAEGAEDVTTKGDNEIVALVPGIGMTVGKPSMHGFAGLHLGFAPPRAVSSIRADGATVDLDEEKSLSYEAGVRLKHRRRWRLHLAGFLSHYFNQIVPASLGDRTTLTNGGATRQLGMESEAKVSLGHLIGRGALLDLGARYTLMRAQFVGGQSDGRQLPYAPNHLLNLVLDLGHAVGVGAQLAVSHVGPQYTDDHETVAEDITGRIGRIDAYQRLDANVRYRHAGSGLTATLAIKDLLDRPFIISRRPEGIFASGFRQILFGLRYDYAKDN